MKIDSRYKLLGLLGNPVKHSLSPIMHNAVIAKTGLKYVYLAFSVELGSLQKAVEGFTALKAGGFNVTVPFKEAILPFLDEIDASAEMIGAVNTVLIKEGRTYGFNTDVSGFTRSIVEAGLDIRGGSVVVLGAGGAAKAAINALINMQAANIYIINRKQDKTQAIIDKYKHINSCSLWNISITEMDNALSNSDLLINATSVGMHGYMEYESPVSAQLFKKETWVCDLVYNPIKTVLLREAEKKGCKTIDGIDMLVHQGADAFKIWTGVEPPRDFMRKQLRAIIKGSAC